MKVASLIPVLLCSVLLAASPAVLAAEEAPPVVNGVTIPQSLIDAVVKMQAAQGRADTPALRNQIREVLITQEILVQEAKRLRLEKQPEVAAKLELAHQKVLADAFVEHYVQRHPISDAQMHKAYEELKAKVGNKEYHAHHILVKTKAEAEKIIRELKKGASFEALAKADSIDSTKSNGGDLGWARPARYVPAFGDALKRLKAGQFTTTPVHTQFGWHIIRVDGIRTDPFPQYDQIKDRIRVQLEHEEIAKAINALRAKAKIR